MIIIIIAVLANLVTYFVCTKMSNDKTEMAISRNQKEISSMRESISALQKENSDLKKKIKDIEQLKSSYKGKVAFLTFDDGPSVYTPRLLDTLAANNVHATFFVVGTNVEKYPNTVKREHAEGHTVGIHCWNHSFPVCYASVDAFMSDFGHIKDYLTTLLGESPTVCRFPGDTDNIASITYSHEPHFMQLVIPRVKETGVTYFDWNVYDGDSDATPISAQQTIANVINRSKNIDNPIILCHDIKKNTVDAMPEIIRQMKALGYSFAPLSKYAPNRQFPAK